MSEFNTIPNLNWLPIEVPQNVKNFIKALESSTELIDNVNAFQYEIAEPRAIYTDFTIEVKDCGEYIIEMALDIDSENPGHSHVQFTITDVVDDENNDFDFDPDYVSCISSNLENYCDSLDEAERFLNKLFRMVKREIIALQEEFAKN